MREFKVMVVGAYGFFGSRLVARLARQSGLHIVVAGRCASAAQALVESLAPGACSSLSQAVLDVMAPGLEDRLKMLEVDALIHTSGPFQGQDYRVALACAHAGVHYVDLADGRDFVCGIDVLDPQAKAAGVLLLSGASSVPALSSAVVDELASAMARVSRIDIGISPGNRTDRGLSTVAAILSYCGKPLPGSGQQAVIGWLRSYGHDYPAPVGRRLLSACDVPDLALLPLRYEGSPSISFGAGLELSFLQRGMNVMAWLAHRGLVQDWSAHARRLKRMADWFRNWGSDAGAMHVTVSGLDAKAQACQRCWVLMAGSGDGPYVPTLAASALARKLAAGVPLEPGARSCMGLLTLQDFAVEAQGLDIQMRELA
ncbi:saccharopine dehydrogenase NADP-binding domain-containing protein [Comamonas sp. NyZ500]|uniref:saccharopine dehydrogenase family protein n=1 Tax=Comamonas sp. NyZ500 TaxID=2795732 RepID=UPI00192C1E71|nr:saccharopine dehydrogenase NADP-binding domain-containing protein [Comamonas sp. NyZ500]MBL5979452.1 saccharopine dehydrogenase NADP-binding domain-containing protein [Comamonas sp. NyZ500]